MASTPEQPTSLPASRWKRICRRLWRAMTVLWGTLIGGIAISTFATLLTATTDTPLPKFNLVHWVLTYPIQLLSVAGGLAALTILFWVGSRECQTLSSLSPDQQSRVSILKALRKAYTDELDASLQGVARIALGLHERFDLTHPARLVSWQPGQPELTLSTGTSIVDAYDRAGYGLLILGEPGAGKSTTLYDLAQTLLTRAERDETLPLPVILNLSSWATKRQPLQEWLAEELELRYLVPRALGRRWQQEGRWLPLLDGLDEVATDARSACIEAINAYHIAQVVPLVVCCRREEYLVVPQQLTLQSAVILQPLTAEQIEMYLQGAGRPLAAVRKVVDINTVLRDLLTTPLMLSVVALAYRDKTVKDLPQVGSVEDQQRHIFASYLQRMLYTHGAIRSGAPERLQRWLIWLAQQMQRRSQSLLYLEQLQPDWLTVGWAVQSYRWWSQYLPGIIIGSLASLGVNVFIGTDTGGFLLADGLLGGLLGGLLSYKYSRSPAMNSLRGNPRKLTRFETATLLGLGIGLGMGLAALLPDMSTFFLPIPTGICFGLMSILLTMLLLRESPSSLRGFHPVPHRTGTQRPRWCILHITNTLRYSLLIGGLIGLSWGLSVGLSWGLSGEPSVGLSYGLSWGLSRGLSDGLVGLLVLLVFERVSITISPTEIMVWSWKSLWHSLLQKTHIRISLLITAGISLILILSIGLYNVPASNGWQVGLYIGLIYGLSYGLSIGGSYWLLVGFFQGVSSHSLSEEQRTIPNQGIHYSIHNGLLLGLLSMVVSTFISGLGLLLIYKLVALGGWPLVAELSVWLSYGISAGLAIGLLVILLMGGLAWWRHWVLRFLLWRSETLPLRIVPMLDEADRHILLRKSGGGYRFIHDLFRDYLASLDMPTLSGSPTPPSP